jgi:hypothetical protein
MLTPQSLEPRSPACYRRLGRAKASGVNLISGVPDTRYINYPGHGSEMRLVDIFIRLLAALIVSLAALDGAGVLDRVGDISVSTIGPPRGHAYVVPRLELRSGALPNWFYNMDGDRGVSPTASSLWLREDGRRMDSPHARHRKLEEVGGGFYSHWNGSLWFSTSDNSDPRRNGRRYTVGLAPSTGRLLLAPGLLFIALLGWRQSRGIVAGLPEIRAAAAGLARARDTARHHRAVRFATSSGIFAPLVSLVVLVALWLATMGIGEPPSGDGGRLFEFVKFVRGAAHGLAFWNPFRNGGYPLFADPEHGWFLSLFVSPAGPAGYVEFNLVFLVLLAAFAVPIWLICRRLRLSPFWTVVLVVMLGFNERLILAQQSGRFAFLVTSWVLLTIVWTLLSERMRPRHYVLLVVCVAVTIEEVVQKAVLYCLVIYAGLLLRQGLSFKQPFRQVLYAAAATLTISLAGLCLSAVWTLPLLAWVSDSHTPISALTYAASIPDSVLDYARTVVPFAPVDEELVSFTSLILLPAAVLIGFARLSVPARRAVVIGVPVYLWALIFISMSLPLAGPLIRTAYGAFPLIAGLRWFAPFGFASMVFLTIGAVGIFHSCESRRIAEVGRRARVLVGGYFSACAGFAFWHGMQHDEALAFCVGAAVGSFALYFLAAASGRVAIKGVEHMTVKSAVGVLTAVSTVATMAAGLHWARGLPRGDAPEAPLLQNIVRNDSDPYFRYVRVSSTNLWSLEAQKRGFGAFSLYFSREFAHSLLYLNPQHDLAELRPHWVRLADCNGLDLRALDLLGTKYVFCRRAALPAPDWQVVAEEQGQTLFRRSDYDGGIRLYCRWRAADEGPGLIARAAVLESFSQRVALVSPEDAAGMPAADPDCPAGAQAIGKIEMVEDRPGRMVLNVTARNGGILVIPDNYSPGWRVSINGKEARALRVYHTYLGARMERGENAVTFEFRDDYFWIGLIISLMTFTGLMIYLAVSFLAGRRASLSRI